MYLLHLHDIILGHGVITCIRFFKRTSGFWLDLEVSRLKGTSRKSAGFWPVCLEIFSGRRIWNFHCINRLTALKPKKINMIKKEPIVDFRVPFAILDPA
jgi:hypothetical protein